MDALKIIDYWTPIKQTNGKRVEPIMEIQGISPEANYENKPDQNLQYNQRGQTFNQEQLGGIIDLII